MAVAQTLSSIMVTFDGQQRSDGESDATKMGVAEVIFASFQSIQRQHEEVKIEKAAASLRHDVRTSSEGEEPTAVIEETVVALVRCIDSAMASITKTKKDWSESVSRIRRLAAAFACGGKDEAVARAVVDRAIEFACVERDAVRSEGCALLGECLHILIEASKPASSILKSSKARTTATDLAVAEWKVECVSAAASALLPRLTDKIAKVRSASISGVAPLFDENACRFREGANDLEGLAASIQSVLLWISSNDSSAANRVLAVQSIQANEDTIPHIIERIMDVDSKVREAAIELLRIGVSPENLDEDQKIEILQSGLTKRCTKTHARTVQLITCNWLKAAKFDPIKLLDSLNPVLNETVCDKVVRVLLEVAPKLDYETSICNNLGEPELRSLKQQLTKKRCLVQDEETPLNASLAYFLRIKCDTSDNKSDAIFEAVDDIPSLCNLLNAQTDKLIEFNKSDSYDDLDEDEAAEFEDNQNFICLQLIHMASASELQEEGSRRHFISIIRSMLSRLATPDDLVDACVKSLASAHDSESHFLQTISEVLADVEDDDTFHSRDHDEKAVIIVRQMRIIAILSIVLEGLSGQMVSHPILEGFFQHLSPAITSKNAVVREHGVICLSKFCLLSPEDKLLDEFMPLLMTIAGSVEERVEVRVQSLLALSDLALIHENLLATNEGSSKSFQGMLLEMLAHSMPGIVVTAAEISAKLLLAGRLTDPNLVAWLLTIYFDTSLLDKSGDSAEVKSVGCPARLQQIISVFFPTYAMSSLDANDALMASVTPLLSIVKDKLEASSAKTLSQWPIAKIIEYICYTVDLADKKENQDYQGNFESAEGLLVNHSSIIDGETQDEVIEKSVSRDDDDSNVEASSTLLASIAIAEFLSKEGDTSPTFYVRALAKILSNVCIDVEAEDTSLLIQLKSHVAEAEYAVNEDGPTAKNLRKIMDALVGIEDIRSDDEDVSSEEEEESEGEDEKENSLRSKSSKSHAESVKHNRTSLGNVN